MVGLPRFVVFKMTVYMVGLPFKDVPFKAGLTVYMVGLPRFVV